MAQAFDISNAPFDRLSPTEAEAARAALDIAYFRPGETIIARDGAPDSLFIVLKGAVEEREGADVVSMRGPGDCFDSRALVQGGGSNAFVAREETLCHLLPRDVDAAADQPQPALRGLLLSRHFAQARRRRRGETEEARFEPDDARAGARPPPAARPRSSRPPTSIEAAARNMSELDAKALLVRDGERIGIVTKTDLADAAILQPPADRGAGRRRSRNTGLSPSPPTTSSPARCCR